MHHRYGKMGCLGSLGLLFVILTSGWSYRQPPWNQRASGGLTRLLSSLMNDLLDLCDSDLRLGFSESKVAEVLRLSSAVAVKPDAPLRGWRAAGPEALSCPIHGLFQLRFTSDQTHPYSIANGRRGQATSMTFFNASSGGLSHIVDFNEWRGKVKGFRVEMNSASADSNRLQLTRRSVVIERRSHIGLNKIALPAVALSLLSPLSRHALPGLHPPSSLVIRHIDDELLILQCERGHVTVMSRLYDFWDPAVGWKMQSVI